MRQLQRDLAGHDRMVLFRDAAEQDAAFAHAFGDRFGGTEPWPLPIEVETRLFTDPAFNESAKFSLQFFDPRCPLLFARMGQLRGDLMAAVQSYAAFRFAENPLESNGKTPIPPQVQQVLDFYATYYLGLAKLDQKEPDRRRRFLPLDAPANRRVEASPAAAARGPAGRPYFSSTAGACRRTWPGSRRLSATAPGPSTITRPRSRPARRMAICSAPGSHLGESLRTVAPLKIL